MVPRPPVRRERNNDYSAVGTAGRRTGVTLPQARLDENGLEEITGLFSSPVKPSPVKLNPGASVNDVQNSSGFTPTQTLSARRSLGAPALPPPRSASPRKSGISGSARRSNGIDIASPSKGIRPTDPEDHENSPSPTPIRVKPRRFIPSPDKRPVKGIVPNGEAMSSAPTKEIENSIDQAVTSDEGPEQRGREVSLNQFCKKGPLDSDRTTNGKLSGSAPDDDSVQNPMGDDEIEEFLSGIDNTIQDAYPVPDAMPEVAQQPNDKVIKSIETTQPKELHQKPAAKQKNGRKRKSEEMEEEPTATSSKRPAKKPRATKAEISKAKGKQKVGPSISMESSTNPAAAQAAFQLMPARLPGLTKDPNTHLSQRQQAELDQIIERVKARPGKLKTLYVLKREKSKKSGADDVRSGRAVVKPLAYWSAEQCVHNEGGAAGLELGARIPLTSIQEITRDNDNSRKKKKKKNKAGAANEESSDSEEADAHEEAWEREIGVFRGQAHVWDESTDTPEVDLAFHPSSIILPPVRDSPGFSFAKLVSKPFFGSGIIDLAPGAVKRPKNSRSMHMCFFVVKGRVTVRIGQGMGGEEAEGERFGVGKGGVFQVPRGNKYAIENERDKPARIFFSQGSETVLER